MTDSSTSLQVRTTDRARYDAYLAGMRRGIALGAAMMLMPDEKNKQAFRRVEMAERMREYAANAEAVSAARVNARYWPSVMPGGWPLPPTIPGDESTFWPEVDGWPCPPPHLRGQSLDRDSEGQA